MYTKTLLTSSPQDADAADIDDEDNVHIQVEADDEEDDIPPPMMIEEDESENPFNGSLNNTNVPKPATKTPSFPNNQDQFFNNGMDPNDFSNMMTGFNNMDYSQMMQMMSNGMGNFNAMMGKFLYVQIVRPTSNIL